MWTGAERRMWSGLTNMCVKVCTRSRELLFFLKEPPLAAKRSFRFDRLCWNSPPRKGYRFMWQPCSMKRDEEICPRSEEHTSELQSRGHLVCRLLLEKKNSNQQPLAL